MDLNTNQPLFTKNNGMFSNLVFLPCKIHLPLNKKYKFYTNGERFQVILVDKKRALTIIDSNNEFLFDKGGLKKKAFEIPNPVKYAKDPHGDESLFFCKEAGDMMFHTPYTLIITDFESNDDVRNCKKARVALEYFIKSYQNISRDTLAFTPTEMFFNSFIDYDFFYTYKESELALPEDEKFDLEFTRSYTPNNIDVKAYHMKSSGGMDKKEIEFDTKLGLLLDTETKNEFILSTIYKAESQIYPLRNYKYALLDFFFVIESVIYNYVTDRKRELGISATKLREYKKEVSISYMINIELPILIQPYTEDLKNLLIEVDSIRKIRNNVVHNQGIVTEVQANSAKIATTKLLKYLKINLFSTIVPFEKVADIPMVSGLSVNWEIINN